MLRSRRFALVAATVLVGLSACGDTSPRTTAAVPPAVIHLADSTGGSTGEAATAERMMMPFQDITFVIDGEIADPGAAGPAWTLPGDARPDTARISEIARLLGVEGDVRELAADQGGGWMVGAQDYSTATLSVSADGLLSWWYNPAPQTVATVSSVVCAQPGEPTDGGGGIGGGTVVPECEPPPPPAGVPDEAAARDAAQQLFSDMGYAVGDLDQEVYADEWGANVTAYVRLDGNRSPITLSVGYGADGVITWASGSLATPVQAGEYPLVGIDAGLARLNDETGRWSGYWGGPMPMARTEVAAAGQATATGEANATGEATVATAVIEPGVSTDPVQVGEPISIEPPVCDPAADCVPGTMPVPEPITVHLRDASLGQTMVWALDGTIWLLPAYIFGSTDGAEYTVIAVDDAFLDLPEPFPTEPFPTEPFPTDSLPIEPFPIDSLPSDTAPGETPVDPLPVDSPPVDVLVDPSVAAELLVGLTLDAAGVVADGQGWSLRVSTLDGVPQALTMDFSATRVNVSVVAGLVAGVDNIG